MVRSREVSVRAAGCWAMGASRRRVLRRDALSRASSNADLPLLRGCAGVLLHTLQTVADRRAPSHPTTHQPVWPRSVRLADQLLLVEAVARPGTRGSCSELRSKGCQTPSTRIARRCRFRAAIVMRYASARELFLQLPLCGARLAGLH